MDPFAARSERVAAQLKEYDGLLAESVLPDPCMVYLADGYFVSMPRARAREFLERRAALLRAEQSELSSLRGLNEEGLPVFDIVEELDEDGKVVNAEVKRTGFHGAMQHESRREHEREHEREREQAQQAQAQKQQAQQAQQAPQQEPQKQQTKPQQEKPQQSQSQQAQPKEAQPQQAQPQKQEKPQQAPQQAQPKQSQPKQSQAKEAQAKQSQPKQSQAKEAQPKEAQAKEAQAKEAQPQQPQKEDEAKTEVQSTPQTQAKHDSKNSDEESDMAPQDVLSYENEPDGLDLDSQDILELTLESDDEPVDFDFSDMEEESEDEERFTTALGMGLIPTNRQTLRALANLGKGPEAERRAALVAQGEAQGEAQVEAQVEAQGEAKGETKSEAKGEAQSETKSTAQSEAKGEAKNEAKGEKSQAPEAPEAPEAPGSKPADTKDTPQSIDVSNAQDKSKRRVHFNDHVDVREFEKTSNYTRFHSLLLGAQRAQRVQQQPPPSSPSPTIKASQAAAAALAASNKRKPPVVSPQPKPADVKPIHHVKPVGRAKPPPPTSILRKTQPPAAPQRNEAVNTRAEKIFEESFIPDEEFLKLHDGKPATESGANSAKGTAVLSHVREKPEEPHPPEDMAEIRREYQRLRRQMGQPDAANNGDGSRKVSRFRASRLR